MKNVLIINAGQVFQPNSEGNLNKLIAQWSYDFFSSAGYTVDKVDINLDFNVFEEVERIKVANILIYHIPIWWFQVPNRLKLYLDEVFIAGHNNGIYKNDGRSHVDPDLNYGTGGLLQNKKYLITTTWSAPKTAFTMKGEFFDQVSVDDGPMFGFHKTMKFVGAQKTDSFHFYDVYKNFSNEIAENYKKNYLDHLGKTFVL